MAEELCCKARYDYDYDTTLGWLLIYYGLAAARNGCECGRLENSQIYIRCEWQCYSDRLG